MTDLVALGVQTPQINTVANYNESQNNAINQEGVKMQQTAAALEQVATMGLGVMDGNPDGKVDPNKFNQMLGLLGTNPLAAKLKDHPELLPVITKGSMNVLQYKQNQMQFQLALKQFDKQLQSTEADIALKNAETTQINNGGKIIPGTPIVMSDGSTAYPTEYGGTRTLNINGGQPTIAPPGPGPGSTPPQTADVGASDGGMSPAVGTGPATPAALPAAAPAASAATPPHILTPAELEGQKTTAAEKAKIEAQKPQQMVAAKSSLTELDQQDQVVSNFIDQALQQAQDALASGFIGKLSEGVAGSPAYKLAKTLDTIKANIGFDKLQALRTSSPTGGALGQVSNMEEVLLQSVSGSLDQGQDAKTIIANLQRMKQIVSGNSAQRHWAFDADFTGVQPPAGDKAPIGGAPTVGSPVVDLGNGVTIQELP